VIRSHNCLYKEAFVTPWDKFKATAFLRLYTFTKIPLIWWISPSVEEMSEQRGVVSIPLTRKTKNHLNVMYFGALAIGAEMVVALRAVKSIQDNKAPVDYIFKDFKANFLKRAEGDVHFVCEQGQAVEALLQQALTSGERVTETFKSYAIVPSKDPKEIVAEFEVTLSMKKRKPKS
jgi:acyl-coenzyme A thioesterase PaaI-like protein